MRRELCRRKGPGLSSDPRCARARPLPCGLLSLLAHCLGTGLAQGMSGFLFVLEKVTALWSSPGGNGLRFPRKRFPGGSRCLRPVIVSITQGLVAGLWL